MRSTDLLVGRARGHGDAARRSALCLVALLACLGALSAGTWGCGWGGEAKAKPHVFPPQTVGDLTATLSVDPYPPVSRSETTLLVALADAQGRLVTGAKVSCDMTMPVMNMPPNQPKAVEKSPGIYVMTVIFTMRGDWEGAVQVTTTDGVTADLRFAMSTR